MRAEGGLPAIMDLLDRIKDYRVLLVGDAIVDEYQYVQPDGQGAEGEHHRDPLPGSEVFAGGVFAAANHVASFCKEVEVVTWLGARDSQEALIRKACKPNVTLTHPDRARRADDAASGASSTPPTCASCSRSTS